MSSKWLCYKFFSTITWTYYRFGKGRFKFCFPSNYKILANFQPYEIFSHNAYLSFTNISCIVHFIVGWTCSGQRGSLSGRLHNSCDLMVSKRKICTTYPNSNRFEFGTTRWNSRLLGDAWWCANVEAYADRTQKYTGSEVRFLMFHYVLNEFLRGIFFRIDFKVEDIRRLKL